MNYDDMEPGPELDALVARRVMGWKPDIVSGTCYANVSVSIWDFRKEFTPSTSIAAAWEIVEKLSGFYLKLNSPFIDGQPWFAGFTAKGVRGWNGAPDFSAKGDTAPLAICRAALKACA